MCIGETNDTLDATEQAYLTRIAKAEFPRHRFALRRNDDGITWVLLTPWGVDAALPKVTICRVDPCILVMLEDQHARRQFRSLVNVEAAVEYIHAMSDEALRAAAGLSDQELALQ
jgi:hypothetical protein